MVKKEAKGYLTFYGGYHITNAFKATIRIYPPNTGIVIKNPTTITTTKTYALAALILIALSSLSLVILFQTKLKANRQKYMNTFFCFFLDSYI